MDWPTLVALYPFLEKLAPKIKEHVKKYVERLSEGKNPESITPFLAQIEMLKTLRESTMYTGIFAGKLANPSLREDDLVNAWKFTKDNAKTLGSFWE